MTNLKQKAFSGIKVTGISTFLIAIIQIIQLSVLARFLDSSDFGIMAIIMVVIGFSQSFSDMGISNGIIHKHDINNNQLSTLYWLNIVTSVIIFLIVLYIAPLIAKFYNSENLSFLIPITASVLILQSFGQQFEILLQKDFKFKILSIIELISKFMGLIVAIILAIYNFGIYSLIYGTIIPIIVKTILLLITGLKYHRPQFIFNLKEAKYFINFGLYQMGERMIYFFNTQIDIILIGKILGNDILGIYSLAKQFVMRPAALITPILFKVLFPIMSQVQNDKTRLSSIYLKTINLLSSVIFPIYALIIIFSYDVILIFFGDKWTEMIHVLEILAIYAGIRSVTNFTSPLVLSTGRVKRSFYWSLSNLALLPPIIYLSTYWGITGVSLSLVLLQLILIIPNWKYIIKNSSNILLKDYIFTIFKPLFILTILTLILYYMTTTYNILVVKVFILFIFILIFILYNKLFNIELLNFLKDFLLKRNTK